MTTPEHRERVLKAVAELWEKNPHQRLGQVIYNAICRHKDDIFYVTDEELVRYIGGDD